jgi:hypothetical protein
MSAPAPRKSPSNRRFRAWLKDDPAKVVAWVNANRDEPPQCTKKAPGPGMLTDFVALAEAEESRILAYAKRWGPLCICGHGLPCSHNRHECAPLPADARHPERKVFWEPLASWRHYATEARAILHLAALSHDRKVDDDGGLARLLSRPVPLPIPPRPLTAAEQARRAHNIGSTIEILMEAFPALALLMDQDDPSGAWAESLFRTTEVDQRRTVEMALNRWIDLAAIRPVVRWSATHPTFEMTTGTVRTQGYNDNLFAALTLELTYGVLRQMPLRKCDACGRPHSPRRWPRANEHSFCRDCGKRAAWRLSKRRARAAK